MRSNARRNAGASSGWIGRNTNIRPSRVATRLECPAGDAARWTGTAERTGGLVADR